MPPTKSVSISLAGGNTQECSSTGGSQIEATANIITAHASGTFGSSEVVTVGDNTPPDLNIRFIDRRSGEELAEVSGSRVHFVTIRYDVADVCDAGPIATSGVAVPVHSVDDGDTIRIKHRKISTIRLNTSALNVSAKATDASGNQRTSTATLPIND